jgi:GAF domain-containing protein
MTIAERSTRSVAEVGRLRAELSATQELVRLMAGEAVLQTVLEAVTRLTVKLLGTGRGSLHLLDGGLHKMKVNISPHDGRPYVTSMDGDVVRRRPLDAPADEPWESVPLSSMAPEISRQVPGLPPNPGSVTGCAVLERRTAVTCDVFGPDGEAYPVTRAVVSSLRAAGRSGFAAAAATPLLRGGQPLGVLTVLSSTPYPFTPEDIALLETFAAQAALAIENARLFQDLQDRLEEQTATARVLEVISRSPTDLQTVLDTIVSSAARLCDTDRSAIASTLALVQGESVRAVAIAPFQSDAETGSRLTLASPGIPYAITRTESALGRAVADRAVVHITDLEAVPVEELSSPMGRRAGLRSLLAVPLLRGAGEGSEGRDLAPVAIGALALQRRVVRPFTDRQIAVMQTFADQAVIAIENARLFSELQDSNRTLNESLEQQTATAEVLKLISRSAFDLDVVLHTLLENAVRLCGAASGTINRFDGQVCRFAAGYGITDAFRETLRRNPMAPDRVSIAGRVMLDRRVTHISDVETDPDYQYPAARVAGFRSLLGVPLLREGDLLGVLVLQRYEPVPYTEREIALVTTFADQAAIAMENTRLISELRERDERRRQELERASAIQQRLLPDRVQGWPGVLEISHRFRPAVETSGDFFDVLRLTASAEGAPPPLQIAIGDVAGKGMAAALVTALARSALRSTTSVPTQLASPAGTLRLAGARLHQDVGAQHFVACALAVVEPPGRHHAGPRLRLANAAQVPVLLVRGGEAAEIEPAGYRLPLGAQDDGDYADVQSDLRPGDVVVFSSDGLVEAPSLPTAAAPAHLSPAAHPGELFGFARLSSSAAHWATHAPTAEAATAGIWSDLTAWCGDESHHDDMTLLVLRVPEPPR